MIRQRAAGYRETIINVINIGLFYSCDVKLEILLKYATKILAFITQVQCVFKRIRVEKPQYFHQANY